MTSGKASYQSPRSPVHCCPMMDGRPVPASALTLVSPIGTRYPADYLLVCLIKCATFAMEQLNVSYRASPADCGSGATQNAAPLELKMVRGSVIAVGHALLRGRVLWPILAIA